MKETDQHCLLLFIESQAIFFRRILARGWRILNGIRSDRAVIPSVPNQRKLIIRKQVDYRLLSIGSNIDTCNSNRSSFSDFYRLFNYLTTFLQADSLKLWLNNQRGNSTVLK